MLHFVHELVANCACLLSGTEQVVCSEFLELVFCKQLPLETAFMQTVRADQNSKLVGLKAEATNWKKRKLSVELREQQSYNPVNLTLSHLLWEYFCIVVLLLLLTWRIWMLLPLRRRSTHKRRRSVLETAEMGILLKRLSPWCSVQSASLPSLWIPAGSQAVHGYITASVCIPIHCTEVPRASAAGVLRLSLASRVWPHQAPSCLLLLSEQKTESGRAPLTVLCIPHALSDKELTQIQRGTSPSLLSPPRTSPSAGVSASHRPETPGLGNYGNFWMTSDQKMNDFI